MEFGTAVLPRRFIAVRSNRDCASRSGLATTASTAMVLVGKKSITAVRGSSRDQSASSGDRRAWTALLADMGSREIAARRDHTDAGSVLTGTEGCVRDVEHKLWASRPVSMRLLQSGAC